LPVFAAPSALPAPCLRQAHRQGKPFLLSELEDLHGGTLLVEEARHLLM
jgi:hypothetical protein